jgi:hypothetical protein
MASANVSADIAKLIEAWAPEIQKAFLDAIARITDAAQVQAIVAALARGDTDAAMQAVGLEPAAFRPLDIAVSTAYESGGEAVAARLAPMAKVIGTRLNIMFDARNLRAESWLRNHSSTLVTEIVEDQRTAIRQHLEAGMAAGQNPRTVALDLVGRINVKTGKREGGVIGLTSSQAAWARNFEQELTQLKPEALNRKLRDKRFDAAIAKAIKSGTPLSPALITKMVTAYRNRALKSRADSIGRTEAMTSLQRGQKESMQQAIDKGTVKEKYVTKEWVNSHDTRVRHTHQLLGGQKVPFAGRFKSVSGATLDYPGDPEAPAAERIQCRCNMRIRVDYIAQAVDEGA